MAQKGQSPTAISDDLTSVPKIHMVERENQLHKLSSDLYKQAMAHAPPPTLID